MKSTSNAWIWTGVLAVGLGSWTPLQAQHPSAQVRPSLQAIPAPILPSGQGVGVPSPYDPTAPTAEGVSELPGAPFDPTAPTGPTLGELTPGAAEAFQAAPDLDLAGLGQAVPGALVMFGDQAPIFGRPIRPQQEPPFPPQPPQPPQPRPPVPFSRQIVEKSKTVVPWMRAFKMADNQSPVPQDRVFFNFNYFNGVNQPILTRFNSPITGIEVFRYQLGVEKTVFNGYGSVGVRGTLDSMWTKTMIPNLGGTDTALGDLDIFFKYVFWENLTAPVTDVGGPFAYPALALGQRDGGLFSTGMTIRTPTGPSRFANSPFSISFRNTALQPFLGTFWRFGNFYFHGIESIYVPLDLRDVVMLYTDVGLGYFLYRNEDPTSWVRLIAPTFEVHVNVPLTHRDIFDLSDPVGTADVVDLTYGVNALVGNRTLLSTGIVTPVTGPRPFDFEVMAMVNIYFGGTRRAAAAGQVAPPIFGM